MIDYRDRSKPLTAEDVIRRFNLGSLEKDRKAISTIKDGLTKTNTELEQFTLETMRSISDLQDQVDGNITTWFYSGIPTLLNEPSINWETEEIKINHLGDLYYDNLTGYCYRFACNDSVYSWIKITDNDLTEALAIANSAKDTADAKRRTFIAEPIPPYDIGDIWFNNGKLYRCKTIRTEGSYNSADWIDSLNYTDDTVALQTKAELNQFKTEVQTNYITNATLTSSVASINANVEALETLVDSYDGAIEYANEQVSSLDIIVGQISSQVSTNQTLAANNHQQLLNKFDGYTPTSKTAEVENNVLKLQTDTYTKTEINTKLIDGSVKKISTTSGTFDEDGMHYEKSGAKTNSTINEIGVAVNNTTNNEELLFAGYDEELNESIVRTENLTVRKYLQVGSKARYQDYEENGIKGTGVFTL